MCELSVNVSFKVNFRIVQRILWQYGCQSCLCNQSDWLKNKMSTGHPAKMPVLSYDSSYELWCSRFSVIDECCLQGEICKSVLCFELACAE